MEDIVYPKQLLDYRPIVRRPEQPLQRLLDEYNREAEKVIYWPYFLRRRNLIINIFSKKRNKDIYPPFLITAYRQTTFLESVA
jgi:hypothetical protein